MARGRSSRRSVTHVWQQVVVLLGTSAAAVVAVLAVRGVTSGPIVWSVGVASGVAAIAVAGQEYLRGLREATLPRPLIVVMLLVSIAAVTLGLIIRPSSTYAANGSVRITGGCPAFLIYGQNRWAPLGAKILKAPQRDAEQIGTVGPNKIVYADGWLRTESGIPLDSPPWNSDVWFHLDHDGGWVDFGGVRALPTTPDPSGGLSSDGGEPVPVLDQCHAVLR
jgi:hypothetical protein